MPPKNHRSMPCDLDARAARLEGVAELVEDDRAEEQHRGERPRRRSASVCGAAERVLELSPRATRSTRNEDEEPAGARADADAGDPDELDRALAEHRRFSRRTRGSAPSSAATRSGSSSWRKCPAPSSTTSSACGISRSKRWAPPTGANASSLAPQERASGRPSAASAPSYALELLEVARAVEREVRGAALVVRVALPVLVERLLGDRSATALRSRSPNVSRVMRGDDLLALARRRAGPRPGRATCRRGRSRCP